MQNDFVRPDGALYVPHAEDIIPRVNDLIKWYDSPNVPTFYSKCWHLPNHPSFKSQGGLWPSHCVAYTFGAAIHHKVLLSPNNRIIAKGVIQEAYSAFEETPLHRVMSRNYQITDVDICGLALDYCVLETALAAVALGYSTSVFRTATLPVLPSSEDSVYAALQAAGVKLIV